MPSQTAIAGTPKGVQTDEDELTEDERLELERSEKIEALQRAWKQVSFVERSNSPRLKLQLKELEQKIFDLKSDLGLTDEEYSDLYKKQQLEEIETLISIGERTNNREMIARAREMLKKFGELNSNEKEIVEDEETSETTLDDSDNTSESFDEADGMETINISDLLEGDQSGVETGDMTQFADQQQPKQMEDTMIPELADFKTKLESLSKERLEIKPKLDKKKTELAEAEKALQALQSKIATLKAEKNELATREGAILTSVEEIRAMSEEFFK